MRAPWKRSAAIALATCGVLFLPLISGCKNDVDSANAKIRADIETATSDLENGNSNEAVLALQKVAGTRNGSPEAQIESTTLLAQSETDAADAMIRRLGQQEAQITGLLGRMQVMAWQIATNGANIAASNNLNPSQGEQAYQKTIAAAQQGEGGTWIKGEAPIPSLADVNQRMDDLQKKIDALNQQKSDQAAKRAAALKSADKFDQQADATTGDASTGFFTQGAAQRKEAADDQTRIRDLDAKILPLQQQLDVARIQKQAISDAIESAQKQDQQLQSGWQNVQKQIEAAQAYTKMLVSGGGAGASEAATTAPASESASLESMASQLNQFTKAAEDLRSQAISLLNSAMEHYTSAQDTAAKLVGDLTRLSRGPDAAKLPEKYAWQQLIDLNQPAGFKLAEAGVLGRLARIRVDQYLEMAQRNALARLLGPAFAQAKLEMPPALAQVGSAAAPSNKVREQVDKLEADMNKSDFSDFAGARTTLQQLAAGNGSTADQQVIAGAMADLNYFWSDTLLSNGVIQGNTSSSPLGQLATNLAHAQRMIDYYGWAQFAGLEGKSDQQKGRMATAQSEYKALDDAKATYLIPAVLPPGLAPEPTSQPATQPTSEPTSQPAAESGSAPGAPPQSQPAH